MVVGDVMTTDEQDRITALERRIKFLTLLHVLADGGIALIIILIGVVG